MGELIYLKEYIDEKNREECEKLSQEIRELRELIEPYADNNIPIMSDIEFNLIPTSYFNSFSDLYSMPESTIIVSLDE